MYPTSHYAQTYITPQEIIYCPLAMLTCNAKANVYLHLTLQNPHDILQKNTERTKVMANTSDFSSKLKELRLKKGLSQNNVAERLNVSRQAVSHWENGKGMPDIHILPVLSELYDISIDELFGLENSICDNDSMDIKERTPDLTKNGFNREHLILMLFLIASLHIEVIGVIISICVFIWTWRNRKNYKSILISAAICILLNLNNLYVCWLTEYLHFETEIYFDF